MAINAQTRFIALETIRSVLTEKNTDQLRNVLRHRIKRKLPRWARFLPIGRIIDALLPEVLLEFFEDILE